MQNASDYYNDTRIWNFGHVESGAHRFACFACPQEKIMHILPLPRLQDLKEKHGPVVTPRLREAVNLGKPPPLEVICREDLSWLEKHACPPACRDQAYRLHLDSETMVLSAAGETGWRHGLATLAQLIEQTPDQTRLPGGTIEDVPQLAWRGLQYDIARGMTYRHDHLKQVVRDMAGMKLNLLHLYLEGRFAYPSHPELHQPGLMDLAETLHDRFATLFEQLGNNAENLTRTKHFLDPLHELDAALEHADGLPAPESWCPPALCPSKAAPTRLQTREDFYRRTVP